MENTPGSLDLDALSQMYEMEADKLRMALINGASWDDMREQRHVVTELAIAIHRQRKSDGHPAGNDHRPT